MKTLQRISLLFIFLVVSIIAISQNNPKQTNNYDEKGVFTCDSARHTLGSDTFTLFNASLISKMMTLKKAGKVLYDTTTKTLLAYEFDEFTIKGEVIVDSDIIEPKVLKYTMGDDKAYIK